jgi:NAD(P)-dependent dehydrogenase (short-subunit alcohol dehydrogenase family)
MRNVLITGASSGFGRVTAQILADKGFKVFAGARKQSDIDKLNEKENIIGVKLDIRNSDQIQSTINLLEKNGGLYALINNAGIVVLGGLVELNNDKIKDIFETNLFGIMSLTQACFPLLQKSKGKIINISSVNGFVTGTFYGLYPMTKFALEAYSESLRGELKKFEIQVSVVEPGQFKTPIFQKLFEDTKAYHKSTKLYKEEMDDWLDDFGDPKEIGKDPIKVASKILKILNSENSNFRFFEGSDSEQKQLYSQTINRLLEINANSENPWTLDELKDFIEKQESMRLQHYENLDTID